jgi:dTDP-4-amino-4,6-dideoxygalactose transaminase
MIPRYKPFFKPSDFINYFIPSNASANEMDEIEREFAKRSNSKYALVLPYGRSAYYFLLKAFDIKEQEFILPAYTCHCLACPVTETNNIPVFIDSSPAGFNMNNIEIDYKISEKTRAIMFTEIWGEPVNIGPFRKYKSNGIFLIGDYSLSLFGYFENNNKILETLDIAFFSFGPGKEISALGGGMLITDNQEIFDKIRNYRDWACTKPGKGREVKLFLKMFACMVGFSKPFYKTLMYLSERTTLLNKLKDDKARTAKQTPNDFFILPTKFQLYIIKRRLENISHFITERHHALNIYYTELKKDKRFNFHSYSLASYLAIEVDPELLPGLQTKLFSCNVHTTTIFKQSLPEIFNDKIGIYPYASKYAKSITMLPLFYGITEIQIKKVVSALKGSTPLAKTNQKIR